MKKYLNFIIFIIIIFEFFLIGISPLLISNSKKQESTMSCIRENGNFIYEVKFEKAIK